MPLATVLSGANRTDMKKLADLLDARLIEAPGEAAEETAAAPAAPPGTSVPSEPNLCLDRGYDYEACRETATAHGYTPHIPPKTSQAQPLPPPGDPARHPPRRWVVEAAHSWFNRFRRLLIRWEKRADTYLAFVQLAACLIIYRKLHHARLLSG